MRSAHPRAGREKFLIIAGRHFTEGVTKAVAGPVARELERRGHEAVVWTVNPRDTALWHARFRPDLPVDEFVELLENFPGESAAKALEMRRKGYRIVSLHASPYHPVIMPRPTAHSAILEWEGQLKSRLLDPRSVGSFLPEQFAGLVIEMPAVYEKSRNPNMLNVARRLGGDYYSSREARLLDEYVVGYAAEQVRAYLTEVASVKKSRENGMLGHDVVESIADEIESGVMRFKRGIARQRG